MKKVGIVIATVLFAASCGITGYNLEPSFLRYPFEKIFDYELNDTESGNEVVFVSESTVEEGVLIYEYFDEGAGSISNYYTSIWDGSSVSTVSASIGDLRSIAFPLSDANTFVQVVSGETFDEKITVFQADISSFSVTELASLEVDFSTDFASVGNAYIGNPVCDNGRLYFTSQDDGSIYEMSYQVSSTAVDDPQYTWASFIQTNDLYTQFFSGVEEGDTFWQDAGVEIDGYRHYPELNGGTTALVASMDVEFQESSDIRFLILYNGSALTGLQLSSDVYNVLFLSDGYVATEESDADVGTDIFRLYDCTGTEPSEIDSLTFQTDEVDIVGESVYNDEAVILWTLVSENLNDRTQAALYALPVSYLLGDEE